MIDFGLIQENAKEAWRLLKQDLKDDWLQDPLLFRDRRLEDFIDYFQKNVSENCGVFRPSFRQLIDIPKGKGALRYSLETNVYDRLAYQALGVTLVDHLDVLISRRILNHRLDITSRNQSKRKYLFLNPIEQWRKFEQFVKIDAHNRTVLITDIQNYYENVNISKLKDTLIKCLLKIDTTGQQKARLRFCIDSIVECLSAWSFNGSNGLPQNRDISSFLANIYLMPVDFFLLERDYDFYRYMDDMRFLCEDRYQARKILKELVGQLRRIGLNINSAKTFIHEPESDTHKEFMHKSSYSLEMIDSMLNSKKKPIVAKAFAEVKGQFEYLIEQGDLSSSTFRFFNARMCKLALCHEIVKPAGFFGSITSGIISGLYDSPEVSDQFYLYLSAVELSADQLNEIQKFLLNKSVAIYGWQNYLLWKLLVLKNHRSDCLLDLARSLLHVTDDISNQAGAVLYLGAFGDSEDHTSIASQFATFDSFFLQRHALIALQCSSYKDIKGAIENNIITECRGILKTLKRMKGSCFVEAPEPLKYSDLIREVSFYV